MSDLNRGYDTKYININFLTEPKEWNRFHKMTLTEKIKAYFIIHDGLTKIDKNIIWLYRFISFF